MGKLSEKIGREKPWAILGISRRQYDQAKPWKKTPFTRTEFENVIRELPASFYKELKLDGEAETLVEAIFGGQELE